MLSFFLFFRRNFIFYREINFIKNYIIIRTKKEKMKILLRKKNFFFSEKFIYLNKSFLKILYFRDKKIEFFFKLDKTF